MRKKLLIVAMLTIFSAALALATAKAVRAEEKNAPKEEQTTWTCLKRQFTDNPCPDKSK